MIDLKPVFLEEMKYLGIDVALEHYLWVDSRCYYGFNDKFEKVKFGRKLEKLPKTGERLITHSIYADYHYKHNTAWKVRMERKNFEDYLIENKYDEIILSVSGGKDSTVCTHMIEDIARKYYKTRVLVLAPQIITYKCNLGDFSCL